MKVGKFARRLAWGACAAAAVSGAAHAQFVNTPSTTQPDNAFDRATYDPRLIGAVARLLEGSTYANRRAPLPDADAEPGALQTGDLGSWPRLYRNGDLLVTGILNGAIGAFGMNENLFGPPPALAAPKYTRNPAWAEFFIEPGLSATFRLSPTVNLYGSFSYVESSTRGTDNTGAGNIYYGNRELLFAGVRWRDATSGLTLDASYGQQDFTVGNQMLIGRGASDNTAQRGANQLGPRNAWANAGILKATWQDFTVQGFYLKPNESPNSATGTIFNGINVEWLPAGPVRLGAMYLYVPESDIETRDKLNIVDLRARVHPIESLPQFWLQGEYVAERKSSVAADGWYVQATYNALDAAWKPLIGVRYASLSGDKSGTSKWEGFDPLYFSGGNPNWYQGKIGSSIFNNTNLNVANATLTLTPDDKNIIELLYLYFSAAQTNSPLSIPAVGTVPTGGGGVPSKALASEFDVSYTYTINKYVNINAFAAYAVAGSGLKQSYAANGGDASGWWFYGAQLNFSY